MEIIRFISFTLSNIFMSVGIIYSYSKITKQNIRINIKNIFIIIFLSTLLTFNNNYNIPTLKIIGAFFIVFMIVKLLFNNNIKDTFIINIILTIMSILIEFLSLPLMAIKIENIDILNNEIILKLFFSTINTLILILIIKNRHTIKFLQKIISVITNFINFYTFSVIFICLINIVVYTLGTNIRNSQLTIVIIISILMLLFCLRIIINDKYNNNILKEKNKILKDEHKAYSNTIDECRELKHNLKNELYSIKAKFPKNEQDLINSIIIKYNTNYEWINTLNDIPEGLQGLIYLKIHEAKKKHINIILDSKSTLKTYKKDYIELCNIIGILIDNAIEASKNAKSKNIAINIFEEKNILKIQIMNKYVNNIDINEMGKKNYSTKEYKSGLGLNFINKLKNNNVKVDFKILNDLFITKLQYTYKKH